MSVEVNEAVEEAHRKGVLTCASLLIAGAAAQDAVARAKRMPELGVGLHLALYGAPAQCAGEDIPGLMHADGSGLGASPMLTGARISVSLRLQAQARREVAAQFDAFRRTGLALEQLDGHWHCHQHPFILETLIEIGASHGLKAVRVPYEPPFPSWRAAGRRGLHRRLTDAAPHRLLAANMRRRLRRAGLASNDWFFGKNDGGALVRRHLIGIINELPLGVSEIGLHPSVSQWAGPHAPPSHWQGSEELRALLDPETAETCRVRGIELIRFRDVEVTRQ